ncbi:MAG: transcriptional regulator [Deltaproteobacteria bacterium]|nr:MAG: transcriptional regulator [Deltaproteobacteria bacterium]
MTKPRQPRPPREQSNTPRQSLLQWLNDEPLTARDLSQMAGMSEKDVYAHLPHLAKSLKQQGLRLEVLPAGCQSCGYLFEERAQFTKPSRCPECRRERIDPPAFSVHPK